MKGVVYQYPMKRNFKYHRWFISYSKDGHYVEENFDSREAATTRKRELKREGILATRWTRERALPDDRLRPERIN